MNTSRLFAVRSSRLARATPLNASLQSLASSPRFASPSSAAATRSLCRRAVCASSSSSSASFASQRRWTRRSLSSHPDFESQSTAAPSAEEVTKVLQDDVSSNDVFLYMKGVPAAPQCGFSMSVVQILSAYGVKFGSRNVLENPHLREGIKQFSDWPTIPQLYIKGEFIGGRDIVAEMHQNGELKALLDPISEAQKSA